MVEIPGTTHEEPVESQQPIIDQPKPPSLRQQIEILDLLVVKGKVWDIVPELFPNIKPLDIGLARFYAAHNLFNTVREVREVVLNPQLREKLGKMMTSMLKDPEEELDSIIDDSKLPQEIDETKITLYSRFYQAADFNQALETAIRLGLVDQVNSRNFPALRAVSPKEMALLKMDALNNRLDGLRRYKQQFGNMQTVGFKTNQVEISQYGHNLEEEIKHTEGQFLLLLEQTLGENR